MAPTTLEGQKTKTSPYGRNIFHSGAPLKMCELLNQLGGPVYIERTSVHDVKNVIKTKKAIKKGIEYQMKGKGYSFIEVLSMCPTNWGLTPLSSAQWIKESMAGYYPLGVIRDKGGDSG